MLRYVMIGGWKATDNVEAIGKLLDLDRGAEKGDDGCMACPAAGLGDTETLQKMSA